MNDKPILRMKLDLNEFTNLNKSHDMFVRQTTYEWVSIDISKYNIDRIHNIYSQFSSKVQIFEKNIKFIYHSGTKELTIIDKTSNIITIDFESIVEQRELKLKELGI
jgi:uncharacterized FlaG/YvyC family protein